MGGKTDIWPPTFEFSEANVGGPCTASFAVDLHSFVNMSIDIVFVGLFGAQTRCRSLHAAVTPRERVRVTGERVVGMARRHCRLAGPYAFPYSL